MAKYFKGKGFTVLATVRKDKDVKMWE